MYVNFTDFKILELKLKPKTSDNLLAINQSFVFKIYLTNFKGGKHI